jgi:hypothetical protein
MGMEYKGHKGHHHRVGRKDGGGTPEEKVYAGQGSNVVKEAEEKKHGGRARAHGGTVEGHKAKKHRLDRPGRKRGGRAGADMSPLTTAAKITEAKDHKADDDGRADGPGDIP